MSDMSRPRTSSTRAALVLELLIDHDPDVLSLSETFALSALGRELRQKVLDHSALWESMTRLLLPSLDYVPENLTPRGRNGFLWCLRLKRDDTLRVRPTPIPDVFRRGVETPKSITFMTHIFTQDGQNVLSDVSRFEFDAEGKIVKLDGSQAAEHSSLSTYAELWVNDAEQILAVETLAAASAEARSNAVHVPYPLTYVSARVILFFVVDDEGPPIVLLNEFESFFNTEDHLEFSTDVSEAWLRHADFSSSAGLSDARLRRGAKFQAGCDLRYGPGSLPFDPVVRVYLSPAGMERRLDEDGHNLMNEDSIDRCTLFIEVDFHDGEFPVPTDQVLPALLRLREDHKNQPLF